MIVGVVANFNATPFKTAYNPLLIVSRPESETGYSVKLHTQGVTSAQLRQTIAAIGNEWTGVFPVAPFRYQWMDEYVAKMYRSEAKMDELVNLAMIITIVVSGMGLFGLAALTARRRTKEIGIRKVLGAGLGDITALVSREFVLLVGLALVIASPVAWYFLHDWLQNYVFRVSIGWWVFGLAAVLAVGLAVVTVGFHAVRAGLANPVKSLRVRDINIKEARAKRGPYVCGGSKILLLFSRVLASCLVVDTGLAAITCRAADAVHRATEADGAVRLVFFEEAAGAGAEPVCAVVPAAALDHAGLVADQGGMAIAIADTGDGRVTVKIVDDVAFLVVAAVTRFGVGHGAHLDAAETVAVGLAVLIEGNGFELVTAEGGYVFDVLVDHRAVYVEYPLADVAGHIIKSKCVREEGGYGSGIDGIVVQTAGNTHVIPRTTFEVSHEGTLPAAVAFFAKPVDILAQE